MSNIIDFLKQNKKEAFLTIILLVFSILAIFDFFNKSAISYIEDSFTFALSNIGIVAVLKIIVGALPLTSGISDILDKIFNFFFLANILIGIQYVLLIINKILFVKILIILFFALRLIPQFRLVSTKILIILLFFNPGLNLYINAIKIISNEANMTIDNDLKVKMENIKNMLGITPPQARVMPEIDLNFGDTRSATSKLIGEIGMMGQSINDGAKSVANTITSPIDSTTQALDNAKEKMLNGMQIIGDTLSIVLNLTIKYILNVFFLYFLMPIVYFYILYRVVSNKNPTIIQIAPNAESKLLTT
ncbi:hypothetical protein CCY99_03825 [Helicobacter sp. 16-1353]|uniref:hypothetical protein n=1 Tax=Helicobacter sp. 16-1353 TaxID=2004996 RepID=UPI000DCB757B|nr:hypothetical protein [Helicobacter sp. 16-1353]RAX54487.1 hypothetical protein CCY99_03825 [Helicobacter sp. 16-1353]